MFSKISAVLLCLWSSACMAQPRVCLWGPVTDPASGQAALNEWVSANELPGYQKEKSGFGLEQKRASVVLELAGGTVVLAWQVDEQCEPHSVTITAPADYEDRLPDEQSVLRLALALRDVSGQHIFGLPRLPLSSDPAFTIPLIVGVILLGFLFRQRIGIELGNLWRWSRKSFRDLPGLAKIRVLGFVLIFVLLPHEAPSAPGLLAWMTANRWVLFGVFPLICLLWAALTGLFGYGSPRRADWPAIAVFLFALAIRELYARHGVQGIELHFHWSTAFDRHSVVYTLYVMFVQALAQDPFKAVMHVNGIVSSLAALPLYLFVRQRTGDSAAALFVALFYAVHPILVQMAPSDAPYGLCFATWFFGLALLTTEEIGPKQLLGAAGLLGIAATCRAEGSLYLLASALLLPLPSLWRAMRRNPLSSALALAVGLCLLAVHLSIVFPGHINAAGSLPLQAMTVESILRAGLLSVDYNDPLLVGLVLVGTVAGICSRELRLGLGAALATLIVVWPFATTTTGGFTILHRLSPACALQVIAAGVGAAWITRWIPLIFRQHWLALLPGVAASLFLLVAHRHEIHDEIGITDEFWMLRNHLAPAGLVKTECKLMWVSQNMDTDLSNFEQVVPGIKGVMCDRQDCLAEAAAGGCIYYFRGINCFHSWPPTTPECLASGKTATGGYFDCIKAKCVEIESGLDLELVEQRTVDVHSVFSFEHTTPFEAHFPLQADVGLYRVLGVKK